MPAPLPSNNRVLLAMSGGVDSSVAALRLLEGGYEVLGMTLELVPRTPADNPDAPASSSLEAAEAKRVCRALGIEHYALDYRKAFEEHVISPFCASYRTGETPNPCIECNRHIKFTALEKLANDLHCAFLATGHYARTRPNSSTGRTELLRAADLAKDQSYVLWPLSQDILRRVILPLGELTKQEVRKLAANANLPTASKQESQDICFIPDGDYARFIEMHTGSKAKGGPIMDASGQELGQHAGLDHYTIGQRKGLGVAAGEPLYVLAKDASTNSLVVGAKSHSLTKQVRAKQVNWVSIVPPEEASLPVKAKCLYRQEPQEALLHACEEGSICLDFSQPIPLPAPGQSLVCYSDERVVCGGIITGT